MLLVIPASSQWSLVSTFKLQIKCFGFNIVRRFILKGRRGAVLVAVFIATGEGTPLKKKTAHKKCRFVLRVEKIKRQRHGIINIPVHLQTPQSGSTSAAVEDEERSGRRRGRTLRGTIRRQGRWGGRIACPPRPVKPFIAKGRGGERFRSSRKRLTKRRMRSRLPHLGPPSCASEQPPYKHCGARRRGAMRI